MERLPYHAPLVYFTPRERQVLEQMLDGRPTKRIAAALGISTKGVYPLLAALRRKLGVEDDRELVGWAIRHEADVQAGKTRNYVVSPKHEKAA